MGLNYYFNYSLPEETFTGKELDEETGLYYFGARYYDAALARWSVTDPAGQFATPYGYAGNPVSFVDPDGEFVVPLIAASYAIYSGIKSYQATGDPVYSIVRGFIDGASAGISAYASYQTAYNGVIAGDGLHAQATIAGTNRVVASEATRLIVNSEPVNNVLTAGPKWSDYTSTFVASTFIQASIESSLNYNSNFSNQLSSYEKQEKNFYRYGDMPEPEIWNMSEYQSYLIKNKEGIPIGLSKAGLVPLEILGWKTPPIIYHGATASFNGNPYLTNYAEDLVGYHKISNILWPANGEYFLSGSSHQDAVRMLGSVAPPTQILGRHWHVYATTGLFGSYGGSGSLPVWFNYQFNRSHR
jgi:RHS repeat-associated protein